VLGPQWNWHCPTTIHGKLQWLCSKTYCIAYMDSILSVSKSRIPYLVQILRQQTQKSSCQMVSATSYIQSLLRVYMSSRNLQSVSEQCLAVSVQLQRGTKINLKNVLISCCGMISQAQSGQLNP